MRQPLIADLDNDGDLDLVVNNINEEAYVLENNSNKIYQNNYLKVKFIGNSNNTFGIGATVKAYYKDQIITEENYTTKGYLSSVEPKIHFGLGDATIIDSLQIIWSTNAYETLKNVQTNQEIEVFYKYATKKYRHTAIKKQPSFLVNS